MFKSKTSNPRMVGRFAKRLNFILIQALEQAIEMEKHQIEYRTKSN